MATHTYSHNYPPNDQHHKYYNWGVQYPPETNTERIPHYTQLQDQTDYYSNSRHGEEIPATHTDYSQVSAVDTGFKKLKSNQMEILKQLKRQYEVLRSTELDSDTFPNKKFRVESRQSINDSGYHSRSSSKSVINQSRRKSQQKEWQIVSLEKKQLEVMLNNSMKKIEQLLTQEIQLKKTILQLKSKLEYVHMNESQYELSNKKQRDQNESLKRTIQQSRRQCQSLKVKIKELTNNFSELQSQASINQLNLKKKDDRLRAMEEEVYLQKNKFCNLQLDLKKANLQIQLIERSYKQQLSVIQRRLSNTDDHLMHEKNEEIKRLTHQNQLKDERYKMLLSIASKGNQDIQSKQYIKKLQELVNTLKQQKNQKTSNSEQLLSQTIKKVMQLQQKQGKPDLQLNIEVATLRRQLQILRSQPPKDESSPTTQLLKRILQLQKFIQQENLEKIYFVQDLKKMQSQFIEERKAKDDALKQIKQLKILLQKAEDDARKYSYQLDTAKNLNVDLTQSQHQQHILMVKTQQLHLRDSQVLHLKQQNLKLTEKNKALMEQYEEEIKTLKRQLNEKQCQVYRIKEELELKNSLTRTQFQAELNRLQQDLQRTKKAHATELNQRVNQKVEIQGKLLQKSKQSEKTSNQLSTFVKQRDTAFQNYRNEYEQKLKVIQQRHSAEMSGLVERMESLANISDKHQQIISRNASMEQELAELKRLLRANRQINEGVDHLWRVKEAQYSNLNSIIKQLQGQ